MESPRPTDRCELSDVSFPRPDSPLQLPNDNFVESQQCSADPGAFVGFHVPSRSKQVEVKEKKRTLKLVLDLDATTERNTIGGSFRFNSRSTDNLFNELLADSTQDEESAIEKEEKEVPLVQSNMKKFRNNFDSSQPTMLMSLELAWRDRKREGASARKEEREDSLTKYSEYSEDLAPRIFHETISTSVDDGDSGEVTKRCDANNSNKETDDEEIECTQTLEEDEMTGSYERVSDGEVETEVYPYSDAGTLPFGACSSLIDDVDKKTSEKEDSGHDQMHKKHDMLLEKNSQQNCEDEVPCYDISQDCLTPRVNLHRPGKPGSADECEDEQDECVPTQPAQIGTESEIVGESSSPSRENLEINDDQMTHHDIAEVDPQTRAIRSLEFSFTAPESQDHKAHTSANLASEGTPAAKRVTAIFKGNRLIPFESSISPVYQPSPPSVNKASDPENPIVSFDTQLIVKKNNESLMFSDEAENAKKEKPFNGFSESSKQMAYTPKGYKRKRDYHSPGSLAPSNESTLGDPQTPRPSARRSSRSNQSTPSSTSHVRTRTRTLTPVPSQRAYASRSRTLFKYKFEFCLTGFVKNSEESLKELIEGHGGKVPERYQDVLYKDNSKAVVIATPVSWRKRKFMQAVACGIPVGTKCPLAIPLQLEGLSVILQKKCLCIFQGFSFGIVSDVSLTSKSNIKDKANLMAFILKACGADAVYEDLSKNRDVDIDMVLCDEYTPTCRYFKKKRHIPVKDFQWVTECMILQKILDPEDSSFEPQHVGSDDVLAATAAIGDSDNSTLKLYTGELVMADISGGAADHYLLFDVCEILSIHVNGRKEEGSQSKQKGNKLCDVILKVGILRREPYHPELSKSPVKVVDISFSQVKRRVVAISKAAFRKLKYKDESIFYLEDDGEIDNPEHAC
ncbi:putative BRCT domain-containing protein [Plasmopara halstedii]